MTDKRFTVGTEILKQEHNCCICNTTENLEPHHIFHTTKYDELYNSIDNVVVMCNSCHNQYHQKYHFDLSFKTLLEFQRSYWREHCPELKAKNKKLQKQNKILRKRIRSLTE